MRLRGTFFALIALLVMAALAAPASAGVGLKAYKAKARGAKQLRELRSFGFDLTEGHRRKGTIEIVATRSQVQDLRRAGLRVTVIRDRRGRGARRVAAAQAADGWQVWRPYARTGVPVSGSAGNPTANIKTQMERIAQQNPQHHEADHDRALDSRSPDLRDEGDEGRTHGGRRQPPGGALLVAPARA